MSVSQFAAELFRRYPKLFLVNVVLAMVLMAVDGLTLVSIAPVVSLLTQGAANDSVSPYIVAMVSNLGLGDGIEVYLSVFVVLTILNSILMVAINYFILQASFVVREDMLMGTAERVLDSGINFINQRRQGDIITTLTLHVERVADAFTALTRMIAPIAQIIVLLWIPLLVSWKLTLIAIAVSAVLLFPLKLFRRRVYTYGQNNATSNNNFFTAVQESLQNIRLISSYANENVVIARLKHAFTDLRNAFVRLQFTQSTIHAAHPPVGLIVVFVTFLAAQALDIPLAEVAVLLYAFHRMAGTIATVNQSRSHLISWYPAFEQVLNARADADRAHLKFGDRPFHRLKSEIRLADVSFGYSDQARVLDGIDLSIPADKMTALVGPSGAGKSTLADLIMGLQRASSGVLTIDGTPIEEIDIKSYRSILGYVPQQTSLFNASIRDNIAWSRPTASDEDILAACRLANADQFIGEMEDGLDTVIGDGGVRLSGGQVQRISLARALVRKPSLLILDEATSALDTESEKFIQAAIDSILGQTTVIVIAHRLSTIAKADNIVVMDHGRIVEQGRYDDLISRDGLFADLVANQKL